MSSDLPMTTLTIRLDGAVVRWPNLQSAGAGTTTEAYAGEILRRAMASSSIRTSALQNETRSREAGYEREEEIEHAIRTGIADVRRAH